MKTILLTDSCSDLPIEYIEGHQDILKYVGMPIHVEGMDFVDDMGKTVPHTRFYDKLRAGSMATTSQISPAEFLDKFKACHEAGKAVLYFGLSSGLSGTYNNAVLAKNMLQEDAPDAQVFLVESKSASIGQGVLVLHALEMIQDGAAAEDIAKWLEEKQMYTQHWFAVDNLQYLKNGGRIPPAMAAIGTALKIKPILTIGEDGKIGSYATVRGRKKSMKFIVDKVKEHMVEPRGTKLIIGHGNCLDEAVKLKQMIMEASDVGEVHITELSATIASHVGPDMIALAFVGARREQKK